MKKLSLRKLKLKLEQNDLLQRNQLKSVFGGYGGHGFHCYRTAPNDPWGYNKQYFYASSFALASAWEDVWKGLGYKTECISNFA